MAPKVKSNKKSGKQSYQDKKNEYKLEDLIRRYITLGTTNITYKQFTHAMACRVLLKPLEKQHNLEINITQSYLLKWKHMGYLAPFNDLAKNPLNVAFIGPGQKYYKITT